MRKEIFCIREYNCILIIPRGSLLQMKIKLTPRPMKEYMTIVIGCYIEIAKSLNFLNKWIHQNLIYSVLYQYILYYFNLSSICMSFDKGNLNILLLQHINYQHRYIVANVERCRPRIFLQTKRWKLMDANLIADLFMTKIW